MKKVGLYIRLNILYMLRNKVRFVLTVIGITVGLFVFIIGNVAVDGYIDSLYKKAYDFDEDSFLVYDEQNQIIQKIQDYDERLSVHKCNIIDEAYSINKDYTYKNVKVSNAVSFIGLETGVCESSVPYYSDEYIALSNAKIIYGNDFSDKDIKEGANVIIIEKSTAIFWFQKENAVGEYVDVVSPYGYDRFVVVGVIEDLPARKSENLEFNKLAEQEEIVEYSNNSVAYTTYNYIVNMVENEATEKRYIVNTGNNIQNEEMEKLVAELNEKSVLYGTNASITSQGSLIEEVNDLAGKMRGFINAIIIVLILISGFMIVTIYIFSVKERMYEIGVRRAIGASEFDIACQFIIEGTLTALIGGIITLFVCVITCNLATSYLIGELYMDIRLVMSKELIASMFGLSVLQGIIFCFLPALIASKIRPTEAIRWD